MVRSLFCRMGNVLPHIRHISRNVELSTWVKILLRAGYRWTQALIFHPAMS